MAGLQLTFVCENKNGFHAVCGDYVHTIDQKEIFSNTFEIQHNRLIGR